MKAFRSLNYSINFIHLVSTAVLWFKSLKRPIFFLIMFLSPSVNEFSLCKEASAWLGLRNDFSDQWKSYILLNYLLFAWIDCGVWPRALPLQQRGFGAARPTPHHAWGKPVSPELWNIPLHRELWEQPRMKSVCTAEHKTEGLRKGSQEVGSQFTSCLKTRQQQNKTSWQGHL